MSTPNVWLNKKQLSSSDLKPACRGRNPWYSHHTKTKRRKPTFLIGVAGGTASGKTSVCRAIVSHLQLPWVQILSLDCFYRPLTPSERLDADIGAYNFDHPNAFDWSLLLSVLQQLKQGKAVTCPQYDFTTHSRKSESTIMYGADVVLCEGILMLHRAEICQQFDVKVFVNTDDDIRLIRRITRDMAERGRTLDGIISQYTKTVKPSYQLFCEPTQSKADIVIPRGRDNIVAIQLLCDHIKNKLFEGGNIKPIFYEETADTNINNVTNLILSDASNVAVVKAIDALQNGALHGPLLLQTLHGLCDHLLHLCLESFIPRRFVTPSPETTPPSPPSVKSFLNDDDEEEIVFYDTEEEEMHEEKCVNHDHDEEMSDEHETKVREEHTKCITTPTKHSIIDDNENDLLCDVCVVTIFSGGIVFGESIVQNIVHNKSIGTSFGSIHIFHESKKSEKPRFYDRQLPRDIHRQKVIMLDAFIGTGNRARMALQVMVDHHVPEENICFICLLASKQGIVNLAKVFPNVQFVCGSVSENEQNKHWETVPVTSQLVVNYCQAAGIDIVDETM